MAKERLPIVCAINANYALPLIVMLHSLKEHLNPCYQAVLYLVHSDLNDDLQAHISRIVEANFIDPAANLVAELPGSPRFPPEAAYPLLLPDLLPPSLDRVIFLDADVLVLDDLAQLWATSLGDRAMAAAQDMAIPLCGSPRGVKEARECGIPENAIYFNCGVMLIHLNAWREREVKRRALGYLQRVGPRADFLHQEALNAVLWNDCAHLDPRWNLLGSLAGRSFAKGDQSACQNPGIVHFAGRFKPWRSPTGGPFYERYRHFLSQATQFVPAPEPGFAD